MFNKGSEEMIKKWSIFCIPFFFLSCFPTRVDKCYHYFYSFSMNVSENSIVILDGKKVFEIDIHTGMRRTITEFKKRLIKGYTHFSSMPWGSYRIGNLLYFGVGLKIDILSGDFAFIEPFGVIANNWGKYIAIIFRYDPEKDTGIVEGIRNDGKTVLFGDGIQLKESYDELFEEVWGYSPTLLVDLTPNSLYGITRSGKLLKVDLNTLNYNIFPLGLTEPDFYVDFDVSHNENYIAITTYVRRQGYAIYVLDKDLRTIDKKMLYFSPYFWARGYKRLLFSKDEKNLFVFLDSYGEPVTGIKYHLEDDEMEIFDFEEVPALGWYKPYGLYKYYLYPEKLILINLSQAECIAGLMPQWGCMIIKESSSKLYPMESECWGDSFQYIFRDEKTEEIKSWIVNPHYEMLKLLNLSTQNVEFEMPIEWEWWE